jgi:2'-5' RNA ligase
MGVFLGWMPDAAAQAALANLRDRLRAALPADAPRHDWRLPAQWHATLRYLGDSLPPGQRERLETAMPALAATPARSAGLAGAQYWPHARVLVARIQATDALKALLASLEAGAQACGFARERAQTPHVTLAYLPRGAQPPALTDAVGAIAATPLRIDRIDLLQTAPGGYRTLASWPLQTPPTDA